MAASRAKGLVLSLFPGADLFGMAFEREGWCVVRGPDALLGGDVRSFHAIAGRFDGVIGGPPCKAFSIASRGTTPTQGNLIPEFERVVSEAAPRWWVMENVPRAPVPAGARWSEVVDALAFGAEQHRRRRFSSNLILPLEGVAVIHPDPWPTVTATEHKYAGGSRDRRRAGRKVGRRMTLAEVNRAMGLPEDWQTPALGVAAAYQVRGNGVPLQMGAAIVRAVERSL